MENPVKSITISKVLGFAVLAVVTFAILDMTGLTAWILYPVSSAKAKFFPAAA